jgi:hypothetical protein
MGPIDQSKMTRAEDGSRLATSRALGQITAGAEKMARIHVRNL